jgi:hypothetical protein
MPIDVAAAEQFIYANARVLDRHRLAVLKGEEPAQAVLDALRAYRNPDGGFGHALEPDVRTPYSEPAATLSALHVLSEVGARDHPMVAEAAAWIGSIAGGDGTLTFVLPTAEPYPHAPWMVTSGEPSHLTMAIAGALWELGSDDPWLAQATEWCWARLEQPDDLSAYWVKFSLEFLDSVPDEERANAAVEKLRARLGPDGSIPVPGGTENERLTPLTLSERPGSRSRALFTEEQIDKELDELEGAQQDDGGWTFEWLAWSPGQTVEWRGALTLRALAVLAAHGRLELRS